jgi:hypothetical protein
MYARMHANVVVVVVKNANFSTTRGVRHDVDDGGKRPMTRTALRLREHIGDSYYCYLYVFCARTRTFVRGKRR